MILIAAAAMLATAEPGIVLMQRVQDVRALISAGDLRDAEDILRQRLTRDSHDAEAHFLLGMIAVREGAFAMAAAQFRSALAIDPRLVRVRLELARVLFRKGDYRSALRHFRLAEASNLPPEVRMNVNRYLAAIRDAKSWSYRFDIAFAPDSNINSGTDARDALILGLPFTLSNDSRRHSGTGLALSGSFELAPRLSRHVRLRIGALTTRRDYRVAIFNDDYYGAYAGPRIQLGAFDVSVLGTAGRRVYGGRDYQHSLGGRLEATYYVSTTSAVQLTALANRLQFPSVAPQNGWLTALDAAVVKALSPVSSISGDISVIRESAAAPSLANRGLLVGFGYRRELPKGFSVDVRPALSYLRYDDTDPFFGKRREDLTGEVTASLTNQKFAVWQFTPRLSYRVSRRSSNIPLYSFTQTRIEVGLTTDF